MMFSPHLSMTADLVDGVKKQTGIRKGLLRIPVGLPPSVLEGN